MFKTVLAVAMCMASVYAYAADELKFTCVVMRDVEFLKDVDVQLKKGTPALELYREGDNVFSIDFTEGPQSQAQNPWGKNVVRLIQHNTKADTYVYAVTGADSLPKMFALVPNVRDISVTCQ